MFLTVHKKSYHSFIHAMAVTNKKTFEVAVYFNKIPHTLSDFYFYNAFEQVSPSSDSDRMYKRFIT